MARGFGGRGLGSGPHLGLGFGTGAFASIQCLPNDDSFYCQFAKVYSEISMGFSLLMIIGLVLYFMYLGTLMLKKK